MRKHGVVTFSALLLSGLVWSSAMSGSASDLKVGTFDSYKIYHLPFYSAVQVKELELFAHHVPLKRKKGWEIAYIDAGYKLCNPVFVEKIPANQREVLGQRLHAEITYIVVSGSGVAIHRRPDGSQRRFFFREGDIALVPYGHWIGFANPTQQPTKLMAWGLSLTPEMLDQDLEMVDDLGLRPAKPFVLEYLKYQAQQPVTSLGNLDSLRAETQEVARGMPVTKKGDFTVYQPTWGQPINMESLETPPHHYPKRRLEGWRDAHLELGGRGINNFIVQEEQPSFKEIGHKHGGDVLFYGLIGKGYIAMRPEVDSKEKRVLWGPGDFFVLPRVEGGVWHAHANYTDERNRLIYTPPTVDDTVLEDPYVGRMHRDYTVGEDRDQVWQAIKP